MAYLLPKEAKQWVTVTLKEMASSGKLLEVQVGDASYYVLPAALELLSKPLARSKLKILSPFDNLLIQRKRIKALFGFDYLIECYVPEAKRTYGYFCLPILWGGELVARMDCRTKKNESLLHIHHLKLEPGVSKCDGFFVALRKELEAFLKFNDCSHVKLHKASPANVKAKVKTVISDLTK